MNTRQRKKRAKYWFNDKEIYNADITAAEFLYCLLTEFKKVNKHSLPLGVNKAYWRYNIDKMIWSFDQLRRGYPEAPNPNRCYSIAEYKKATQAYQEAVKSGFEAFSKYIGDLWD